VVTYTALLDAALAEARQLGRGDGENGTSVVGHGRLVFDMMRADGVAPNTVSYTAFIDAAKVSDFTSPPPVPCPLLIALL